MDTLTTEQRRRERLDIFKKYQTTSLVIPGILGDGQGNTRVPGFESTYVYVRLGSDGEQEVDKVLNLRVPFIYDMPVYVGYDPIQPKIFQVLTQRQIEYIDSGDGHYPNVAEHGLSHSWAGTGYDLVWVFWNQIADLMVRVTDTWELTLFEGPMPRGTGWVWIASQSIDLGPLGLNLVPGAGARMVLIYIDDASILQARAGAVGAIGTIDIEDVPSPNSGEFPVAGIRLYSTQTQITFDYSVQDVLQLRWPQFYAAGEDQVSVGNRKLIELGY